MARLRILLGDDHTLVCQGFRKILEERREWEVVGEAGDGREAVRLAFELQPGVAILDVGMPQLNRATPGGCSASRSSPLTRERCWRDVFNAVDACFDSRRKALEESARVGPLPMNGLVAQGRHRGYPQNGRSAHPVQTVFRRRNDWIWRGC